MNITDLEVGQVYKNYKELCNVLDEKVKSGDSKMYQMIDWERYFEWKKEGNKFIITKVHSEVLKRIENRGGNNVKYRNIYKHKPHLISYIVDDYGINLNEITITSKEILKWICPSCNVHHDKTINQVVKNNHTKCTYCCSSSGERLVMDILNKFDITYIKELTFEYLKGLNNMYYRFDFGVYNASDLVCIIEYDGEHHDIGDRVDIDILKDEYCLDNNIELLRIHHSAKSEIEYILTVELSKYIKDNPKIRENIKSISQNLKNEINELNNKISKLYDNY